ncbi:MAG: endonuclease/exonuclease/phosphatase family protein [Cyclobacteriaceae bacterium]
MRKLVLISSMLSVALVVFYFEAKAPNPFEFANTKALKADNAKEYSQGDTLSVMTYNIGYLSGMTNNRAMERSEEFVKENERALISFLQSTTPDILAVQEIDFQSKRSYEVNQGELIFDEVNYSDFQFSINWNKRYVPFPTWPVSAHFGKIISGQSIFSSLPMANKEAIVVENDIDNHFLYKAFYLNKLIQIADVIAGKDTIKIVHVHLEAFDKEARVKSTEVVIDLFEKYAATMPVLLIGDFNSKPEYIVEDAMSEIMTAKYAQSAVTQAMRERNPSEYFTFDTREPYQMIDYIIYNENFIQPISAEVLSEAGEISDHFPVRMEFVIKPQIDNN